MKYKMLKTKAKDPDWITKDPTDIITRDEPTKPNPSTINAPGPCIKPGF